MGRKVILDDARQDAPTEKFKSKHKGPNVNNFDVNILTTKVAVSKNTKKVRTVLRSQRSKRCIEAYQHFQALTKLGAKFTEDPLECTHLIAGAFVRTEKLLCSIAVAPFILQEKWLTKSVAKRRFLRKFSVFYTYNHLSYFPPAEKNFRLKDREAEAKYSFKMKKTIKRARKIGGRLLEGTTFYMTQRVDVDTSFMKSIVAAHGGTVCFLQWPSRFGSQFLTVVAKVTHTPPGKLEARPLCYIV